MTGKLAKSMALNAAFLRDELTDNFPNRFGKRAEKVVQGLGKQLGRMEKFRRWWCSLGCGCACVVVWVKRFGLLNDR